MEPLLAAFAAYIPQFFIVALIWIVAAIFTLSRWQKHLYGLTGLISSVIKAVAWSFLLAAVFSPRDRLAFLVSLFQSFLQALTSSL